MSTSEILQWTQDIARQAGGVLMEYYGGQLTKSIKTHKHDFATEADVAAEELIINAIQKQFPDDSILAEESGIHTQEGSTATWVIDPLDGTRNFAEGIPHFGVMIARVRNDVTQLGVIYNPVTDMLASTEAGQVTRLNNKLVQLNGASQSRTIVSVFPGPDAPKSEQLKKQLKQDDTYAASLHSMAANTLAMLKGEYRADVINDIYTWDFCAPDILLREAGLTVTDFAGKPLSWKNANSGVVAAPTALHTTLLQHIASYGR